MSFINFSFFGIPACLTQTGYPDNIKRIFLDTFFQNQAEGIKYKMFSLSKLPDLGAGS